MNLRSSFNIDWSKFVKGVDVCTSFIGIDLVQVILKRVANLITETNQYSEMSLYSNR